MVKVMREIDLNVVTKKVSELLLDACNNIGCKFLDFLNEFKEKEESPLGKEILEKIIEKPYEMQERRLSRGIKSSESFEANGR